MGAESLRLLIDLIAGVERDTHIRLPTELVVRASCRAPALTRSASGPAGRSFPNGD